MRAHSAYADFETTTRAGKECVWLWSFYDKEMKNGTTIEQFTDELEKCRDNTTIYFHNLKFDGSFLTYHFLKNGGTFTDKPKNPGDFTFFINDMGAWYSGKYITKNGKRIKFVDSLKLIPMSIERAAKAFGLEIEKAPLDYKKDRPEGYIPDEEEIWRCDSDVYILKEIVETAREGGLTKNTLPASSKANFLAGFSKGQRSNLFPKVEEYEEVKQAYHGGISHVNEPYKNLLLDNLFTYDVNSLYPSKMAYCLLPVGKGIYYQGEYKSTKQNEVYIQHIKICFELKERNIPFIQLKNNRFFSPTEHLTSSNEEYIEMWVTSVDLKLIKECYHTSIEYIDGYRYCAVKNLMKKYIEEIMQEKIKHDIAGNKGLRQVKKLEMNALYGKFGSRKDTLTKVPYLEDDRLHYETKRTEGDGSFYIPIACFITAYGRETLIHAIRENYDNFVYCDTDSIHIIGEAKGIEISDTEIGKWKLEAGSHKGKYLQQKRYISYYEDSGYEVKCCGLPARIAEKQTFETFHYGAEYFGKLIARNVPGGMRLEETTFKLK